MLRGSSSRMRLSSGIDCGAGIGVTMRRCLVCTFATSTGSRGNSFVAIFVSRAAGPCSLQPHGPAARDTSVLPKIDGGAVAVMDHNFAAARKNALAGCFDDQLVVAAVSGR